MDIKDFRELPAKIKEQELILIDKAERTLELNYLLDKYRLELIEKIADMKDDNGKDLFSNETKRKNELNRILSLDQQYLSYVQELKQIERQLKELRILIDFMRRTFHAEEAIIRGELI